MREKQRSRGFWVAGALAVMPPVYIRCSTPAERPVPVTAQYERLAAAEAREALEELRELVNQHGALDAHEGATSRPPATFEDRYYDMTGFVLWRLQGAVRAAAGPCASPSPPTVDAASFERSAASLRDEFGRHRGPASAGVDAEDGDEARHYADALGLIDRLELAYEALERGPIGRAGAGCLGPTDV